MFLRETECMHHYFDSPGLQQSSFGQEGGEREEDRGTASETPSRASQND